MPIYIYGPESSFYIFPLPTRETSSPVKKSRDQLLRVRNCGDMVWSWAQRKSWKVVRSRRRSYHLISSPVCHPCNEFFSRWPVSELTVSELTPAQIDPRQLMDGTTGENLKLAVAHRAIAHWTLRIAYLRYPTSHISHRLSASGIGHLSSRNCCLPDSWRTPLANVPSHPITSHPVSSHSCRMTSWAKIPILVSNFHSCSNSA